MQYGIPGGSELKGMQLRGVIIMRKGQANAAVYRDYRYARTKAQIRRKERRMRKIRTMTLLILVIAVTAIITLRFSADRTDAVSVPTYKYYTTVEVNQGESLWSVAEDHMTEGYDDIYELMGEIYDINHLKSETLDVGQKIIVPYYSTEYKS